MPVIDWWPSATWIGSAPWGADAPNITPGTAALAGNGRSTATLAGNGIGTATLTRAAGTAVLLSVLDTAVINT